MRPTARITRPLPGTVRDPIYPDSYRGSLAASQFHTNARLSLWRLLGDLFQDESDVCVATQLDWYYREATPTLCCDPDLFVARGVAKVMRESFIGWIETAQPCTVFEIVSYESRWRDLVARRRLYASLGVPEYFIFDPEGTGMVLPLRGFSPKNRRSYEMTPQSDGSLISHCLGLRLLPQQSELRLYDLRTGLAIPNRGEQVEIERQRANEKQRRADELAAELTRLRAELAPAGKKSKRKGDDTAP